MLCKLIRKIIWRITYWDRPIVVWREAMMPRESTRPLNRFRGLARQISSLRNSPTTMRFLCPTPVYGFARVLLISSVFVASLGAIDSPQQQLRSADTAFRAGYAAEKRGDVSSARQQFEKVVLLAPDIAEGHSALGSVLVQLGEYERAIRELVRALALKPADRTAQIKLATASEESGDHERSLPLYPSLDQNTVRRIPADL